MFTAKDCMDAALKVSAAEVNALILKELENYLRWKLRSIEELITNVAQRGGVNTLIRLMYYSEKLDYAGNEILEKLVLQCSKRIVGRLEELGFVISPLGFNSFRISWGERVPSLEDFRKIDFTITL